MRVPDFFVLGAAKSGTTSLCTYLNQHEDVLLSQPKEPVFFEAEWERGPEYYWQTYYGAWDGERAVGEGRVFNLFLPFVPKRIHALAPNAKLIVILRDPVHRAFSHWWHRASRRLEPLSFEAAIEDNLRRLEDGRFLEDTPEAARLWPEELYPGTGRTRRGFYLELGFYCRQLERYLSLFPRDRLQVVLTEELDGNEERVTRALWSFLGVSSEPSLSDPARRKVARPAARDGAGFARPTLAEQTAGDLARYFAPHNAALARLLGRPLGWR
jgi:hypothetical protein